MHRNKNLGFSVGVNPTSQRTKNMRIVSGVEKVVCPTMLPGGSKCLRGCLYTFVSPKLLAYLCLAAACGLRRVPISSFMLSHTVRLQEHQLYFRSPRQNRFLLVSPSRGRGSHNFRFHTTGVWCGQRGVTALDSSDIVTSLLVSGKAKQTVLGVFIFSEDPPPSNFTRLG